MTQQEINSAFVKKRREYIAASLAAKGLNQRQIEAVTHTEGPLLILAGAGSGKTTVVVNRIANLIKYGDASSSDYLYRDPTESELRQLDEALAAGAPAPESLSVLLRGRRVMPWNILAITFTNKAAGELKSRIAAMTGEAGRDVFASTFHSACVRFLRRDAERLGYPSSFTIYDQDDSERVMKDIYKADGVDDRFFPLGAVLSEIGRLKDQLISPAEYASEARDQRKAAVARLYQRYQTRLRAAGAMDFDDLIYNTVKLLESSEELRQQYGERFRYIMVDEYQDTSYAQYRLVELLGETHRNLCVVGDDDQSIYRFRGATIENILGFERQFKGALVVRLEQNYRSTGNMLDAANSVISQNLGRKGKQLWTDGARGALPVVYCAENEQEEARYVAADILQHTERGIPLKNHAILYRMRAQSNALENHLRRAAIPYRVVGGTRFYDRQEIKDIIAYLNVIANGSDDLRLKRIINRPPRKIGASTVESLESIASGLGVSMLKVAQQAGEYPALSRSAVALSRFCDIYQQLLELSEQGTLFELVSRVIDDTGYRAWLEAAGDEGLTRLENVEELLSNVKLYEQEAEEPSLSEFLEEVALVSDIDSYDEDADAVVLMTLHSAKGLEFDYVYLVGMEEGIFPGDRAKYNPDDIEEERRLAYVGITRAKKQLTLTRASSRMLFGRTMRNMPSRFLEEIPPELKEDRTPRKTATYLNPSYNRTLERTRELGFASSLAPKAPAQPEPKAGRFRPGDRINHKVFGDGTILSVSPMGGDTLLEIEFDTRGVKKAMANYAPIKLLED